MIAFVEDSFSLFVLAANDVSKFGLEVKWNRLEIWLYFFVVDRFRLDSFKQDLSCINVKQFAWDWSNEQTEKCDKKAREATYIPKKRHSVFHNSFSNLDLGGKPNLYPKQWYINPTVLPKGTYFWNLFSV